MRVRKQAVRHALPAFTSSAGTALYPNIGRKTKINRCLYTANYRTKKTLLKKTHKKFTY